VNPLKRDRVPLILAVLTAIGLGYDAKVHLHLAQGYDAIGMGHFITQGRLFRLEAIVAILVAVAVLLSDDWRVWAGAGMTGLAGIGAVVLYRYVDVGKIGPVPNMYEPAWFPEKTHSAYAEGLVGVLWIAREAIRFTAAKAARTPASA
jgi:hypothetical protein